MLKKIFDLLKSNFVIPARLNRVHFINRGIINFFYMIAMIFLSVAITTLLLFIILYIMNFNEISIEIAAKFPIYLMLFVTIFGLAFMVQSLRLKIARLHDMNLSGWFSVFVIIPIINIIFYIVIYTISGTKGINKFGEQPKARTKLELLFALIGVFLSMFLGVILAILDNSKTNSF